MLLCRAGCPVNKLWSITRRMAGLTRGWHAALLDQAMLI